jgi:hypothetical protein
MREVTANTIGKKARHKLIEKKQRDLLRRERIRKQLGFFEHDDSSTGSYSEIK